MVVTVVELMLLNNIALIVNASVSKKNLNLLIPYFLRKHILNLKHSKFKYCLCSWKAYVQREKNDSENFTFLKIQYISEYLNIYEQSLSLKYRSNNFPNLNSILFQIFNVKSLKTAMVMESVMIQENANAMTIGNQKQTALVNILN